MGRRTTRTAMALLLALAFAAVPGLVLAHPLGNFTINHYAGLTVRAAAIDLDVVIDMAEIPAFQERQRIDADGDGEVTDAEIATAAPAACATQATELDLGLDGRSLAVEVVRSTMTFPSGLGGLATMRLECSMTAAIAPPLAAGAASTITVADGSYPDRIGWREIVASGDGVRVTAEGLPATSPSDRLTAYPEDLLAQPLDIRSATIEVVAEAGLTPAAPATPGAGASLAPVAGTATIAVTGGIGADLPEIFRAVDLTPFVLLASIATALALGAGHALTPGHGKTLMAAYLVGTRGTALHAVGLGLAVTVSHTLGILVLAALVVGAQGVLPPDLVVRVAPVVAAVTIAAIGGWMVVAELRRRFGPARVVGRDHDHGADHEHGDVQHDHDTPGHGAPGHGHAEDGVHRHGGTAHRHLPAPESTITWRGLFALGLAGGLIPSTSALFILLGAIVAGRPAFGFVLVVVFGLGMAAVMSGVGLAMVAARDRLERLPSGSGLGRIARHAPLVAAVVVLGVGVYLTAQAVGGRPVL